MTMRKSLITAALLAAALAAGAALAQPAGLKTVDGHMADPEGKALYTYDNDTMRGMSHCVGQCARAWPPFVAADDAKAAGDWTLIQREDGKKQWVYKGKPLYSYFKDKTGAPPIGGEVASWKLAK